MKKVLSFMKKNWIGVAVVAFIIGVGSLTGSILRLKQVASDPKNAIKK